MIDQVELLEQHVETLLTLLESSKLKVVELKRANESLQQQIDHMSEVKLQNEQLQEQVQQFETELEGMASKKPRFASGCGRS